MHAMIVCIKNKSILYEGIFNSSKHILKFTLLRNAYICAPIIRFPFHILNTMKRLQIILIFIVVQSYINCVPVDHAEQLYIGDPVELHKKSPLIAKNIEKQAATFFGIILIPCNICRRFYVPHVSNTFIFFR